MKWSGHVHVRISIWQVFLFCFWVGILAGTMVGNWETVKEKRAEETEIGDTSLMKEYTEGSKVYPGISPWRRQPGNQEKFYFLFQKRLKEGGLGWLIGLTICAPFVFCLLAGYTGFVLGWTISWYTIELGILGLLRFFLSCFPQMLLYLPAWAILVWQALEGKGKLRLVPALLAVILFSGGAGLEAFVNPLFL